MAKEGKASKNARVGQGKRTICPVCGNESKPVMIVSGGKKRIVLTCHEEI